MMVRQFSRYNTFLNSIHIIRNKNAVAVYFSKKPNKEKSTSSQLQTKSPLIKNFKINN